MERAILLIDHGSRREAANQTLRELARALAERLEGHGRPTWVEAAHLELAEPDIPTGFARCVAQGARHVVAVPCMVSRGRHVTEDIPRLLERAAAEHPGVTFALAAPLAEQEGFLELLSAAADRAG